jgi:hypothetical protein
MYLTEKKNKRRIREERDFSKAYGGLYRHVG